MVGKLEKNEGNDKFTLDVFIQDASEKSSKHLGISVWNSEKSWIEDVNISIQVALGTYISIV